MTSLKTCSILFLSTLLAGCGLPEQPPETKAQDPVAQVGAETVPQPAQSLPPVTMQELVEASLNGLEDSVAQALAQGFDPNQRDAEQRTLLMYAAFNGQTAIARRLLDAGAEVDAVDRIGSTALMFAASGPGTETVQLLLDRGAQVNRVDSNEHFSALMWAAAEGQLENVKLLLEKGADLSLKDVDGDTAESFARKQNHTAIAQLLQQAAASASTGQ